MGPFGTKNKHGRLANIPKWSLMVRIDPKWSFGQSNFSLAIWDHFAPFRTSSDQNNFSPQKHKLPLGQSALEPKIMFSLVQKSPNGPKMVPNRQKHVILGSRQIEPRHIGPQQIRPWHIGPLETVGAKIWAPKVTFGCL